MSWFDRFMMKLISFPFGFEHAGWNGFVLGLITLLIIYTIALFRWVR